MTGTHEHECDVCHTVWSHGDDCKGNVEAHTCPTCGAQQWYKRLSARVSDSCQEAIQLMREVFAFFR